MTCTPSAGTILPENQATNAWRATDTPRHGQDDGSFRTSGPARMILAPPSLFEAAFPVSLPQGRGISRKDDGAMSLFARLLQAVRSWRRSGRGGPKTVRYAGIAMEQLDHRQLLSVNFTGNVPIDFPATQSSRCCRPTRQPAGPASGDRSDRIVKVSGFDISGIRVSYSPFDDTFSIGLDQPQSGNHPGEVIAGDTDNNGNSGTVNPEVLATPHGFVTNAIAWKRQATASFNASRTGSSCGLSCGRTSYARPCGHRG